MTQTPFPQFTRRGTLPLIAGGFAVGMIPAAAQAASSKKLVDESRTALSALYAKSEKASALGKSAKAVLVFPNITKAGFMIGGQNGEGVLFVNGRPASYHRITAASFGLQAGVQKFGYALFFMSQGSLDYLRKSDGWAIGSGPSVVVVDEGFAKSMNTTTLQKEVYAMAFDQRGLMAGLGLEGSKISTFTPSS